MCLISQMLYASIEIVWSIFLNKSLSFWEYLLLWLFLVLVQLLLRAHCVDHVHHVDRCYVNLLFLGCQWPLCRLQSLLFVLLFFGCLFRVFTDSALVRVPKENRLLFGCLVIHLRLLVFFNEDAVDGLVHSLRSCFLEVFFLTIAFEVQYVFEQRIENSFAFFLLSLLDLDVIASVLDIWKHPVVDVLGPFGSFLDAHVLICGNELIND